MIDLRRSGGRDAAVLIVDYDPAWPSAYEIERARIESLLSVEVHHIGSTAVPGLAAKPIIDMMTLISSYEQPVATLIDQLGYQYPVAFNETLSERRFLLYPTPAARTHHLHLVTDPDELARYLRFRDRLRADPELARRYAELKRRLADLHRHDREAYTDAKTEFIATVEL
jgi:GrpB-like predicted nucleotidyltransferase (UPF0157 family)